jgi:hypothetical protein
MKNRNHMFGGRAAVDVMAGATPLSAQRLID